MSELLATLALIVADIIGYIGDVATVLVTEPLFVLSLGFFVLGGTLGIVSRCLSKS